MSGGGAGRRPAPRPTPYGLAAPISAGRIAGYLGLAVLGLLVGAAGALVHGGWFPGGLLLALAGTGGLFLGGSRLTGTRLGVLVPAGGWMLSVILLTLPRPEGDFVFGAGVGAYLFLFGGMILAMICAALVRPRVPVV